MSDLVKVKPEEPFWKPDDVLLSDHGERLRIKAIKDGSYELEHKYDGKWAHYGTSTFEDSHRRYALIDDSKTNEELYQEAFDMVLHGTPKAEVNEQALVAYDKGFVLSAQNVLREQENKLKIATTLLETARSHMYRQLDIARTGIQRLQKVLYTIELYMGIHEEVTQLQSGTPAPADCPVSLRQMILYMDEEVGVSDAEDKGIDYDRIEEFDAWLMTDQRYKTILPEEKGMVVLRVRRQDRHYGDDPWSNSMKNVENRRTYFLLRNGDNLYRIWADIVIQPRLFPAPDELSQYIEGINNHKSFHRKEDLDKTTDSYRMHMLVIQGILDRTDLFAPVPHHINMFDESTWAGALRLIYDETNLLETGRLSWREFQKKTTWKVGDRIFVVPRFHWQNRDYSYSFHFPHAGLPLPHDGVYNIQRFEKRSYSGEHAAVFYYNPKDTVYTYWDYHERKKAVAFFLHLNSEDAVYYESVTLEDIDFYLHDRVNRWNYLSMLPVLVAIKKQKLEELRQEEAFIDLMCTLMHWEHEARAPRAAVRAAIDWWKSKVIMHRALVSEDSKAVRMIKGYLKRNHI